MKIEQKLAEIVDRLFLNTGATFSGIFIQDKPVISKTIYKDKKEKLEELLELIVYKSHQVNEFIPEFGEEYVYAEGDDVSIFIYFVRPDIAIASVIEEEKPKFALLKLEHTNVARKLKEMEDLIDKYIQGVETVEVPEEVKPETEEKAEAVEEHKESREAVYGEMEIPEPTLEEEKPVEEVEEKTEIEAGSIKDRFVEELDQIGKVEEIQPVEEETKQAETEEVEQEIQEEEKEVRLEDELEMVPEEMEYYDPEVLMKIQKELLKEIGPVGKLFFKRKIRNLKIDENRLTKEVLERLINELANDIIDEKRRERFTEKALKLL
ncbi:MAG: hypothetical protein GXN94_03140 [Aquificae bacterium]|nr:hypothetical protein [Aquificota bacterium]